MRRTAVAVAALLLAAGATPTFAGGGLPKVASIEVGPHRASVHNDSPSVLTGSNTLTVEIADLTADHRVSLTLVGPRGERIAVPLSPVTVLGGPDGGHGGEDSHTASPAESPDAAAADHRTAAVDPHAAMADHSAMAPAPRSAAVDPHAGMTDHGNAPVLVPVTKDSHGVPSAPAQAKLAPSADSHGASAVVADPHGSAAQDNHDSPTSAPRSAAGHDDAQTAVVDGAHGDQTFAYLARGTVWVPSIGTWTAHLVIGDAHGDEVVGEAPVLVAEGGPSKLYLGFTGSLIFGSMLFGLVLRRRTSSAPITSEGRD